MPDPLIGQKLGDYTIIEILGHGGMGRVYRGYDESLERYAAVKVIDTQSVAEDVREEYQRRFTREAKAIAHLNHPNIVGIYQFGEVEEQSLNFMAMQFIEGQDLRFIMHDLHEQGKLIPPQVMLGVVRDIAEALDYAHQNDVIHRDIKPSNIMVTPEGRAVLTDFGLVLTVQEGTIGNTFGSAHYIAPEQAISSAQAVPQSDLYSLGVVLYEMMTGQVPFDDPSTMSVALKHLNDPPPQPTLLNPSISPAIENVIMRTLRKHPGERYRDGRAMTLALQQAIALESPPPADDESTLHLRPATPKVTPPSRDDAPVRPSIPSPSPDRMREASLDSAATRPRSRGRRVLGLLLVVALILAAAVLIVLAQNGGIGAILPPGDTATITGEETAGVVVAVPSDTPAPTRTRPPATTSSEPATEVSPSATLTPIETTTTGSLTTVPTSGTVVARTETAIATRTAAATGVTSPGTMQAGTAQTGTTPGGEVLLLYDEEQLTLINNSDHDIDVSLLVFRRRGTAAGQTAVSFAASTWDDGVAAPEALPAGFCFQVWRQDLGSFPTAMSYDEASCERRVAWWSTSRIHWFWIDETSGTTFDVLLGGTPIQTCLIEAGRCTVTLPEPAAVSTPEE
ncbi:MAG: protein kinase [Anaerolineae bacterium]|nr:protein kinase [Anaerolineae bacterium]